MRVQESEDSAKECKETDSVSFCGGLLWISLWNISVARIKQLIDWHRFFASILEYTVLCDRQVKKF